MGKGLPFLITQLTHSDLVFSSKYVTSAEKGFGLAESIFVVGDIGFLGGQESIVFGRCICRIL